MQKGCGKKMRRSRKIFLGLLIAAGLCLGSVYLSEAEENRIRQEVSAQAISQNTIIPGGMPVGLYMETEGVLVLGTDKVASVDGEEKEPAANIVKSGDYIIGVDDKEIKNKRELLDCVKDLTGEEVILHLTRNGEKIDVKMKPICSAPKEYKLGIWVRDNTQGLGTITFLTGDGKFGALGHGIHDSDTNGLFHISKGTLYGTSIRKIKKGEHGEPGWIEGVIVYNKYNRLGTIEKNTEEGIYGTLSNADELFKNLTSMPAAAKEEVRTGPAVIRCMVENEIQEYEIAVTEVNLNSREVNKGFMIQITDEKLLSVTGGIIQGMSGSPILQNGKIVGAVTHVLVNDPTRGYGIFIENMLEAAE